ncbi:MAG: ribosome maturation factor RimP [Thermodesulfobacteriota bacterium]
MKQLDNNAINSVADILQPILDEDGIELVDIELKNEAGGKTLRIYLDKSGGITLDDCAMVSRNLNMLLDVNDVIESSYTLEVSSPGLRRPLKKESDFKKFTGKKVKIKTKEMIESRRNFVGNLIGIEKKVVSVDVDGRLFSLPLDSILNANLELDF